MCCCGMLTSLGLDDGGSGGSSSKVSLLLDTSKSGVGNRRSVA